jgi:hypothetical protein
MTIALSQQIRKYARAGRCHGEFSVSSPAIRRVFNAAVTTCKRWEFSTKEVISCSRLSTGAVGQSLAALCAANVVTRICQGFYRVNPGTLWAELEHQTNSERDKAHGT